ncbi:MAG: hypothetical protein A2268_09770 [Candidatus Raymondbacteria bacterium RifOxyA12_full_50_37]|uniref:Uncharacterized protein n=1 Tax=Candidatus Raymondbacteria bacterium RIFOXYD12_FULL_49_13 TaxID=1817890 RepID=A0A1F7F1F4_UNCRA|nr:MAG: hypothetical protein A2268_09770 [Candidatus Raymondbacteria bacterium RifOxyA12_full_50_37]OGJ93874.1 MAG: hypothetical protein A2248_06525 [Candidatus Raymondbacteria bacterium RIFOXYA2_FULL_49_16]OGJ98257.1 MAG: hypothetical protein A2453_00640 [Candidatus Raymondbacteria bacterium RIFOXYC2_FULL_50_21]OGJ98421.1 MAG: hypothetical protein A2350_14270 [Candidatus Raymondbacteria bacterium RifOxyB12_full_50_8]OGK00490.1 MAG: hypothetical protein A2519_10815 [Candidatus Raymondbacteria b
MFQNSTGIYDHLVTLAQSLHIEVTEDMLDGSKGGLYLFKGKRTLVINKPLPLDQKIDMLVEVLKNEDLSNTYMLPVVRDLLGM